MRSLSVCHRRAGRGRLASRLVGASAFLLLSVPAATAAEAPGVASVTVDLRSGATLAIERPEIVERPLLPGSVMKVAALAAALEAGLIDPRTRIVCTRSVVVDGHRLTCTHPDLHRPLTASEALTHSCDVYVASVAARLPRAAFDRALISLGLPASDPSVSVTASALGLEGRRYTVRSLVGAIARVGRGDGPSSWKPGTLGVIRDGLRQAVQQGTARALGDAGMDALAKTGTIDAGGISQGLVVGVAPSTNPTVGFAVIVSGGAGVDAAELAVDRLRAALDGRARIANRPTRAGSALASGGQAAKPRAPWTADERVRVGVARPGDGYIVKEMPLDEYVAGVIAGEAGSGTPPAALDALAIAVRTYTLANLGRHASEGFDLCDLTHCQVLRSPTRSSTAAATRTAGRYLTDGDSPAEVFYTASCGGHTEHPSAVWRGADDPAYLPSRPDPACAGEPVWHSELSAMDLLQALRAGGFAGDLIRDLQVTRRTESGRVAWLRVDGVSPPEISGENLRTLVGRVLGWQHVRSTLFDVRRTGAGFEFSGHGAGHGVGLCVMGAANRARAGATAEAVLAAYFPGLRVKTIERQAASADADPAPVLRIQLPQEEEARRAEVARVASRALDRVMNVLETRPTRQITLRFHPTVESYQRASGQSWFTAGSTRGADIDLLPLNVLQRRGLLDSTLRHELAHVLTAATLSGAPRWMYEGVALYAERRSVRLEPDRQRTPGGSPVESSKSTREDDRPARTAAMAAECPSDAEFERASSAAALQGLYERAERCYEREVRAGRSWREYSPR